MKGIILAGLLAVEEYILLHVITCLVPVFLLAGEMVAFVNKQAILRYVGEQALKVKSFFLASFLSFFCCSLLLHRDTCRNVDYTIVVQV